MKSDAVSNLYYIMIGGDSVVLILYVGDLFLTSSKRLIAYCKRDISLKFDMDLGLMHYLLGLEVW